MCFNSDEEVNDLGVKTALSMLKFYKSELFFYVTIQIEAKLFTVIFKLAFIYLVWLKNWVLSRRNLTIVAK